MTKRKNTTGTFLLGTLIGSLIGGLTGLLMAPRSGEETQELIAERRDDLRHEAEKRIDESRQLTLEKYAEARNAVADWLAAGSEILTEKSQEIKVEARTNPNSKEKAAA